MALFVINCDPDMHQERISRVTENNRRQAGSISHTLGYGTKPGKRN